MSKGTELNKNIGWVVQGIEFSLIKSIMKKNVFSKETNIYQELLMWHAVYMHYPNCSQKESSDADTINLTLEVN